MSDPTLMPRHVSTSPPLVALIVGVSAALPMYLWQSNVQVAVASFIIAGYTAWLWASTARQVAEFRSMRDGLRHLHVNRWPRRIARLISDPGFWWSSMFGCATVTGSVWYAGMRQPELLACIGLAWGLVAVCLNFELTLLQPTTRCRRCGFQLVAHLDPSNPGQVVTCPECGSQWSKQQLCLIDLNELRKKPIKSRAPKAHRKAA